MSTITENTENLSDEEIKQNRFSSLGLIPDFGDNESLDIKKVIHHFFVEFNPLYLVSALCIFYGVFLVANNLQAIDQATNLSGQIILFAVLQSYEAMIIAGIAFLIFKARAIRPAIILCLLECVLIFDCTFRLESLSLMDKAGMVLSCIWLMLVFVKTWAVARVMRLEINWRHYTCIGMTALFIVAIIELFSQAWIDKLLLLQVSAWVGAFVLLSLIFKRPALLSRLATSDEGKETAEKCINAGFTIMAAFYFYHILAFLFFAADPSVRISAFFPQFTAISLLLAIIKSKASDIITWGILTLVFGLTAPIGTSYACFILAAVLIYHASNTLHDNYVIVSVFLCYAGYWLLGWGSQGGSFPPLPELVSLPTALLGLALFAIGVLCRNITAFGIIVTALCYIAFKSMGFILPSSELGRGIFILTSGFIVFILGLAINWWLRSDDTNQH